MKPFHGLLIALLTSLTPFSFAGDLKMTTQTHSIVFGMGCFWGAEKRLSEIPGVVDVESGYANGDDPKAGYYDVLGLERKIRMGMSQARNHAEVIKVTYEPSQVGLKQLLIAFWENHDPTQGDRQGNDIGTNYRSAIYYSNEADKALALETRDVFQKALLEAGKAKITTEIEPLKLYISAEDYHQDYLKKNPNGYCGLGGTGVKYPDNTPTKAPQIQAPQALNGRDLKSEMQLVYFTSPDCAFCDMFKKDVVRDWASEVPIVESAAPHAPIGWTLDKTLFATPTIVLFKNGLEASRFTGYNGEKERFWQWLGFQILTPEQQRIAFEEGTERPFTGSHLDEKRPGWFVDPITGAKLFRSDTKFNSGTGWPSFFSPVEGSIAYHEDTKFGMRRVEVRSASSGIHLGHVFDDGPPPTGKRYCINGNVLKFVPDAEQ